MVGSSLIWSSSESAFEKDPELLGRMDESYFALHGQVRQSGNVKIQIMNLSRRNINPTVILPTSL